MFTGTVAISLAAVASRIAKVMNFAIVPPLIVISSILPYLCVTVKNVFQVLTKVGLDRTHTAKLFNSKLHNEGERL